MAIVGEEIEKLVQPKKRPLIRAKLVKFLPFLSWIGLITPRSMRADLLAGLTGAVIVLPQGMAFAMIAGLPPEYGLYTAIVTPVVAALFGSSRQMISGPTIAGSLVVLSVASSFAAPTGPYYLSFVLTLTFLAGVFQFLLGLARTGTLVNFISHTVVVGFTTGAAVLIIVSQLGQFFGLSLGREKSLFSTLALFIREVHHSNPYVVLIATVTLLSAWLIRRYRRRWPGILVGMIVGSVVCWLIDGRRMGVPMVGSLPAQLPPLSAPEFSLGLFRQLASGALALAMLGLIQAISIARAMATQTQQRIDGNQEFISQGLANMVGSFFSCYVSSGSFTRSGVNYEAGAKTPLSALFASLLVALMLLYLAPLGDYLPLPAMAGVIVLVAWNLIDIRHVRQIMRMSRRETLVMVITCLSTFFVPLEFAIYAGVLLSLGIYLQRTSHPRVISLAPDPSKPKRLLNNAEKNRLPECPQMKILRLDGSLFFGAVDHVQDALDKLAARRNAEWKHILILASGVNFIDVAGAEMIVQVAQQRAEKGGRLYLCGLKSKAKETLRRGGYLKMIGEENLFSSKEEAIRVTFEHLDKDRCSLCQRRIFRECAKVEFEGKGIMG